MLRRVTISGPYVRDGSGKIRLIKLVRESCFPTPGVKKAKEWVEAAYCGEALCTPHAYDLLAEAIKYIQTWEPKRYNVVANGEPCFTISCVVADFPFVLGESN